MLMISARAAAVLEKLMQHRRVGIVVFHAVLIAVSSYLAMWLRFDGSIPPLEQGLWLTTLPVLVLVRALTFLRFRLYQGLWRYTGIWDLRNIVAAVLFSSSVFYVLVHFIFGIAKYPRAVFIIDALILTFLMGAARLARRIRGELFRSTEGRRVLIYGAGDAGEMIVRDMKAQPDCDYRPIGFVDDDPDKQGRRIHGIPVLGQARDLSRLMAEHHPEEVLIAMSGAEPATIRRLIDALEPFKIPITTLPNLRDILNGRVMVNDIRTLAIEDLLPRLPIGLDQGPLRELIHGRRILLTGAGGSIGSELARQIASFRPAALVLCDRYENGLYSLLNDLSDRGLHETAQTVIGDITDVAKMDALFLRYEPEIVFHAAAHKHVPLMEENPSEAVKNNVTGTRTVLDCAIRAGADRFILISTDKAVNPTSVMGATKRVAELLVQARARTGTPTSLSAVRFGNVLASNGSVVPRFVDQIKSGGPVTVTHAEVRRYFMLIPEAVQLVLHAAAHAQPGAIYVLHMGEQVRVADLARSLIRLSGFVPDREIAIKFVGLRPGEKMFEELVGAGETVAPSGVQKVDRVEAASSPDPDVMGRKIAALEASAQMNDDAKVMFQLHDLLPEYTDGVGQVIPDSAIELSASPSPPSPEVAMPRCIKCESPLRRSRRRLTESKLKHPEHAKPFACDTCGWHGWLVPGLIPAQDDDETPAVVPAREPNWTELDAMVASQSVRTPKR